MSQQRNSSRMLMCAVLSLAALAGMVLRSVEFLPQNGRSHGISRGRNLRRVQDMPFSLIGSKARAAEEEESPVGGASNSSDVARKDDAEKDASKQEVADKDGEDTDSDSSEEEGAQKDTTTAAKNEGASGEKNPAKNGASGDKGGEDSDSESSDEDSSDEEDALSAKTGGASGGENPTKNGGASGGEHPEKNGGASGGKHPAKTGGASAGGENPAKTGGASGGKDPAKNGGASAGGENSAKNGASGNKDADSDSSDEDSSEEEEGGQNITTPPAKIGGASGGKNPSNNDSLITVDPPINPTGGQFGQVGVPTYPMGDNGAGTPIQQNFFNSPQGGFNSQFGNGSTPPFGSGGGGSNYQYGNGGSAPQYENGGTISQFGNDGGQAFGQQKGGMGGLAGALKNARTEHKNNVEQGKSKLGTQAKVEEEAAEEEVADETDDVPADDGNVPPKDSKKANDSDDKFEKLVEKAEGDNLTEEEKENLQDMDVEEKEEVVEGELEDVEEELKEEEEVAATAGGVGFLLAIGGMIFTAHQMSENPDGVYASVCRLAITISGVFVKIICIPCRKVIGTGNPHYNTHMPISTSADFGMGGGANAGFEMK